MNRISKVILAGALATSTQLAVAEPVTCFDGVCLGADISQLSGIKFKEAANRKVSPNFEADVLKRFPAESQAAAKKVASNIFLKEFDNKTLGNLAKISAICEPVELTGVYLSKSGYPTRVTIQPYVNTDKTGHTFVVTNISRTYPQALTSEQKDVLQKEFENRYMGKLPQGFVYSFSAWGHDGPNFGLRGNLNNLNIRDALRKHPSCATKLSID